MRKISEATDKRVADRVAVKRTRLDRLGSSTLTPVLLEHGLADDVLLLLLGAGKRFFSTARRRVNSRSSSARTID
jgi:hypothetical protein